MASEASVNGGRPPEGPRESPVGGTELRGRLDQVGVILAKGLDLAEAGVSLGVTILNRVSLAAQQKMREGQEGAAQPYPGAGRQPAEPPFEAAEPDQEPQYGLSNRLPLVPGGEVKISFSVNNDSMTEVKKVAFRVQGFAGENHKAALDPAAFAVRPAQKTIAPVDFEKFVLQGAIPQSTPPDVYRGVVVVNSDRDLFIPVVLVVTPP
jgi:hypothetical protein